MFNKKLFKYILLITFFGCQFSSQAQINCGTATINSSRQNYNIGLFKETIDQLNYCLSNNGFNAKEKERAYKLLAMSYLALDSIDKADFAINQILFSNNQFEPDDIDPERFKLELNYIKLQQLKNLVSSVSKKNEELRLAPATINVITAQEMIERGYNDIIDVLKDIPGFDISIYYGTLYANVYQRGFRTNNTETILFLVDGVEDNNLYNYYANISQQYPLSNIKRIEIIYGPASTMYGPNAFSGVINIITKNPEDFIKNDHKSGIDARIGTGSNNSKYADFSYAAKASSIGYSLTGRINSSDRPDLSSQGFWDFDPKVYDNVDYAKLLNIKTSAQTYLTNNKLPITSPLYKLYGATGSIDSIVLTNTGVSMAREFDKSAYNASLNGQPVNKFTNLSNSYYVQGKLNVNKFSFGFTQWAKTEGIGTLYTDYLVTPVGSNFSYIQNYFNADYKNQINNNLSFFSSTSYKIHTTDNPSEDVRVQNYALGKLKLVDLVNSKQPYWMTTNYYQQSKQFRTEQKFIYTWNNNLYLISGIEYRNSQLPGDFLTSTTSSNPKLYGTVPNLKTGDNQYNVNDIGLYLQGGYRTKSGFGYTLGGRLDNDKINNTSGFGTEFSPRVVIDYATKTFVIKTIYSRGIFNVSSSTKFATTATRIANPDLKTQSIDNYELSINKQINKMISADIDFYLSQVHDVVSTINISSSQQQNQNIGEFKIFGIQQNIYYTNKNFKATFNYTYTAPYQTKSEIGVVNKLVGDIADHHFNLILNYVPIKGINLNLRTNYVGNKAVGINTTVPGNIEIFEPYVITNFTLGLFDIVKNTKISLVCNNILDKKYYSPGPRLADGVNNPSSILQMGRNFMIRFNYEF